LGVVRATVDFDWAHERKPQAVTVLVDSADAAYPELKQKFQLEAARKLTELGEYPRAKKLLEALLSQKPLDATIEAALADNYARSGDQAGFASFYSAQLAVVKAATLDRAEKTERIAQLRRGVIAAASHLGNWNDAADQYIELINAYPDDTALTQEAALVAGAHGLGKKLISFYNKTVEASPRDARWSIVLARLDTALEDYPAAMEAYAKAIHVRPEQKDLYESKADLEERLHRLDDAVADYEQLYKLSYRDPRWMVKEAEARARQGRNADAVKALEQAWIMGRPAHATDYAEVATRLEKWDLLDEARNYSDQCVTLAGVDILVNPEDQSCVTIYARIMARLRQTDAAFTRLAIARQQAESVPLTAVAGQVMKEGFSAITSDDWRKQRIHQRAEQAKSGFAQALKTMAEVVSQYDTPEEKAQFAAWLQGKRATAADGSELRDVYLPAIQAAGLKDMESDLLWEFVEKSGDPNRGELDAWLQLQRQRVQLDGVGAKLEALAATLPPMKQWGVFYKAAEIDRTLGDTESELRVLDQLAGHGGVNGGGRPRYMELLLAARPLDLVWLATNRPNSNANEAAQFLVANGKTDLAMAGIAARSSKMPPVWKKAYTGLTGLYLREHTPLVRENFASALGGGATIGERIAHPVDRDEQLAGEVWFYYGSRYGEYLDEEKDAQAEGYLESELEHTPESANAYAELADYSVQAGRSNSALADYQHSLDLKSEQPAVLDSIAAIDWKQGRQADAVAAWQLAVKRLAAEMDARHVPESFWGDFALVLGDIAEHNQYAAVSEQVDAMMRVYIARNGEYRVEPLLEAGYHAHGDSMEWLLEITTIANDPSYILKTIREKSWIVKNQKSKILEHILELEHRKAQEHPDESSWVVDEIESSLINSLLDEKKYIEAHEELARIPEEKSKSMQWLDSNLRLAEAEHHLPQLISQWKKEPSTAPDSSILQNSVGLLSEQSKQIVMRFVYERALNARELTAPNFLGLASIDLDEGDVTGAISLLKRLTLISGNPFADTDSAASLLESRKKYSEVIQFLQPLTQSSPWEATLKVRLAVAMLAANTQAPQALSMLTAVASDSKATYVERIAAARALKGHGATTPTTGSMELNLLSRDSCPTEDEARKPFFVQARLDAAACAPDKNARERLLFAAIAGSPSDGVLRLQYVSAAFETGQISRAIVSAEPILQNGSFYGQQFYPRYRSDEDEGDEGQQQIPAFPTLKQEEASKLTWYAIHAREKRHEDAEALTLLRNALNEEHDSARLHALENEKKILETEADRVAENEARAPQIHNELDQDRVVRPRLLTGDVFVPKKKANIAEDTE
ncbi:MAG: hypothetical protein WAN35_00230, partial [Terracidiphilus sp.]